MRQALRNILAYASIAASLAFALALVVAGDASAGPMVEYLLFP